MMMTRITVPLQTDERQALQVLSERERRNPRDQAAMIIHDFLIEHGLLDADPTPTQAQPTHSAEVIHVDAG